MASNPKGHLTFNFNKEAEFNLPFRKDSKGLNQFELYEISFTFESVAYRLYLFGKVLFNLPDFLGKWLHQNTNWVIQQYIGCKRIDN